MLVKKQDAIKKQNSHGCCVWEYEFTSENMSFATAHIHGQYPESGRVSNLECEEIYFVLSGTGTLYSEKGTFPLEKDDVYHFEKDEIYYVEGNDLLIALINAPKWTLDQHIHIK